MRILFCNDNLQLGGAQRRLCQLILGLNAAGYQDIHVLLTNEDIVYEEVLSSSARFHFLDRKVSRGKFYLKMKATIDEIKPDIVHCWSMYLAYYLNFMVPFSKFKYVCGTITTANVFSMRQSQYYVERLSFFLSDVIVTNSMAGLVAKKAPMQKSKVIYNGYDYSRQKNLKDPVAVKTELAIGDRHVISMASRVAPQKDIDMLVRVAQIIGKKRNDIVFLMLGDGPQLEEFREVVKKEKVDNLKFLGYRNDVESIIHASSICILCSKHEEGVSNSIMEALADGKPVVATESGGTNEIITSGENGFIVKPGDAEDMAEKIAYLVDNGEFREQMGKRAVEIINEKFLLSHMVDEYIKMYDEILKR